MGIEFVRIVHQTQEDLILGLREEGHLAGVHWETHTLKHVRWRQSVHVNAT